MNVIDIGGGFGVDYDGIYFLFFDMFIGYNIEEYVEMVVEVIKEVII